MVFIAAFQVSDDANVLVLSSLLLIMMSSSYARHVPARLCPGRAFSPAFFAALWCVFCEKDSGHVTVVVTGRTKMGSRLSAA
jgi:hypothetical protein